MAAVRPTGQYPILGSMRFRPSLRSQICVPADWVDAALLVRWLAGHRTPPTST